MPCKAEGSEELGGKEFGVADNENDAVAVEFTIDAGGVL
jgi:hypothetical protein